MDEAAKIFQKRFRSINWELYSPSESCLGAMAGSVFPPAPPAGGARGGASPPYEIRETLSPPYGSPPTKPDFGLSPPYGMGRAAEILEIWWSEMT